MNTIVTTLIILVSSVVLGTGVVLYGLSLYQPEQVSNQTNNTSLISQKHNETNSTESKPQFDNTVNNVKYQPSPYEIYPAGTSGIASVGDGYLYFYDFDMDTHNQTIAIQSVDFITNSQYTTLYDIGRSTVGVQGEFDLIPIANLTSYLENDKIVWSYNYSNPVIFTPNSKDSTAKFTLDLLTPDKLQQNLAVSLRVYYITNDTKLGGVVSSKWFDDNNQTQTLSTSDLTQGTNLCTEGFGCPSTIYASPSNSPPAQPYYSLGGENDYYLVQTLDQLIQVENNTLFENAKEYCISHVTYFNGNHSGIFNEKVLDTFDQCVAGLTK